VQTGGGNVVLEPFCRRRMEGVRTVEDGQEGRGVGEDQARLRFFRRGVP
jgi:hypothetical protein